MNILGIDELEAIKEDLIEHLLIRIIQLNREGKLLEYFQEIGFHYGIETYKPIKQERILVIGQSQAKKHELEQVAINRGIDPGNIEFIINYEDIRKFDFHHIKDSNKYKYILVGPMAHKQKGLTNNSSIIVELEKQNSLNVIRIENTRGKLELTKTSFSMTLDNIENLI